MSSMTFILSNNNSLVNTFNLVKVPWEHVVNLGKLRHFHVIHSRRENGDCMEGRTIEAGIHERKKYNKRGMRV